MNKLMLVIIILMTLLSVSVLGKWLVVLSTGSVTGFVTSVENGTVFLEGVMPNFNGGVSIETTNQSGIVSFSTNQSIKNNDNSFLMIVSINTTIIDEIDECNNTGDIVVIWKVDGVVISEGDNLTLNSGNTPVETTLNVSARACPQEVSTTMFLTEIN